MNKVNIGGPIFLAVVGAILWLGLGNVTLFGTLSTGMVGLILLVAALVWLGFGLLLGAQKTKTVSTNVSRDANGRQSVNESEVESSGL